MNSMTLCLAVRGLNLLVFASLIQLLALAQTFNSGSDNSDGALTLAANKGIVYFDPKDTATFGRVLDADGDGIFNFTTISIGQGTTLKFSADRYNRPVYWLASGSVQIAGALDLSGADGVGVAAADLDARRRVAVAGSGGYAGGATGGGGSIPAPATPGEGPAGGSPGGAGTGCGTVLSGGTIFVGCGGKFTGNRYLVPLYGGSGGGGAAHSGNFYFGGAAGGGAIFIASSVSIVVNGFAGAGILANGGTSQYGGCGAGGGIRLTAPTVTVQGPLKVLGGVCSAQPGQAGGDGRVRVESLNSQPSLSVLVSPSTAYSTGFPTSAYLPVSSARISSIGGIAVPQSPYGYYLGTPDVSINNSAGVPVVVQATGIPPSTPITLTVYSDNPVDPLTVSLSFQANLTGTLQSSSATVNVAFPFGLSRSYVRVSW